MSILKLKSPDNPSDPAVERSKAAEAEIRQLGAVNPLDENEIIIGQDNDMAAVDVIQNGPLLRLKSIRVFPGSRGKGTGSKVLELLKGIAAKYQVALDLVPLAYVDKPLSTKQLSNWYARHGFEPGPKRGDPMVWHPPARQAGTKEYATVWIGNVDPYGSVQAQRVNLNELGAAGISHHKLGLNSGTTWRFMEGSNTVFWWQDATKEAQHQVEDFLAGKGFEVRKHEPMEAVIGQDFNTAKMFTHGWEPLSKLKAHYLLATAKVPLWVDRPTEDPVADSGPEVEGPELGNPVKHTVAIPEPKPRIRLGPLSLLDIDHGDLDETLSLKRAQAATPASPPPAIHQPAPVKISATEEQIIAACLIGEAGGEGKAGMEAVMSVISNRAKDNPKQFAVVCLKPYQFSMFNNVTVKKTEKLGHVVQRARQHSQWNTALELVRQAEAGKLKDPTAGATHYHTHAVNPSWAGTLKKTTDIGHHRFYKS